MRLTVSRSSPAPYDGRVLISHCYRTLGVPACRLPIDDGVAVAIASSSRAGSAMPSSLAARISARIFAATSRVCGIESLPLHHILKYKVNYCFSRIWKPGVIRSEIRSRAELNCALPLFLHPSHQRDTAHRPIGTGRLRARRGFGYWGEQIGHLRDRSGHHFGARRQNSSLQPRVETAMENVSLPVVRRLIAKEQHQGRGSSPSPLPSVRFCAPNYDILRFHTTDGST